MYNVKTLNKIDKKGLKLLGSNYQITDEGDENAIILRSYKLHDYEFPKSLLCIARAGAGVNNIPIARCTQEGIVVFNTPGANANGVKEMVLTGLLLGCRDVVGAAKWIREADTSQLGVAKTVEKNKSNFKGCELKGKVLGLVGLGAIGVLVANVAIELGMKVVGYDPYLSVKNALNLSPRVGIVEDLHDLYKVSDFVSLHLPLMEQTKNIVSRDAFDSMKDGVCLLNFARGGLVDDDELEKYINKGKVRRYVTDFPNEKLLELDNVVCIPHLGASTFEAETNCAVMAIGELKDFIENGNVTNSVNVPQCSLGKAKAGKRLTVFGKTHARVLVDGFISKMQNKMETSVIKISNDIFYCIFDFEMDLDDDVIESISKLNGVLKARLI